MKESDLHRKIIAYLKAKGIWCVKLPGTVWLRGMPDILAIVNGRAVFLEVKVPGGEATLLQVRMMDQLRKAGAIAEVVTSVSEALSVIEQINMKGIPLNA